QGDIDVEGHRGLFVEFDSDEATGALGVRPFAQRDLDPTLLRLRRFPGTLGGVGIAERDRYRVAGLTATQRTLYLLGGTDLRPLDGHDPVSRGEGVRGLLRCGSVGDDAADNHFRGIPQLSPRGH